MKQDEKDEKTKITYIIRCLNQGHYPSWEFDNKSSLIPRNITHHILVFAVILDIEMSNQRTGGGGTLPINHTTDDQGSNIKVDLHVAVRRGDMNVVREMVTRDKGMVSRKDSQGNLPLHIAVVNRHKEAVDFLVEKYPQGSYGLNQEMKSPIYLAVDAGTIDLVNSMFEACANDRNVVVMLSKAQPIVHLAIKNQNEEMVRTILRHQLELINSKDKEGLTPLSYASLQGNVNIVELLLVKFQKSISCKNSDGSFPIHTACLGGNVAVLEVFDRVSSNSLFSVDNSGRNVLHIAAKEPGNKLKDVVSYLVNISSNSDQYKRLLNKKDGCGYKPLALAQQYRNNQIAGLLNDAGMS